jgi:uncharacterized protein (DUF1810 family)
MIKKYVRRESLSRYAKTLLRFDRPFEVAEALEELNNGKKQNHWIWFVFPQLDGLGSSFMASNFALDGVSEAQAFLKHSHCRPQLLEAFRLVLKHENKLTLLDLLDSRVDVYKFISCITLFHRISGEMKDVEINLITGKLLAWGMREEYVECNFTNNRCALFYKQELLE